MAFKLFHPFFFITSKISLIFAVRNVKNALVSKKVCVFIIHFPKKG